MKAAASLVPLVGSAYQIGEGDYHCMISYHQQHHEEAFQIRDVLLHAGFSVWVRTDKKDELLSSSEPGQDAQESKEVDDYVAKSYIMIILLSETFKSSEYCKTEVLRAVMFNKQFVIVRMYAGCDLEGWLSLVFGNDATKSNCPVYEVTDPQINQLIVSAVDAKMRKLFEAGMLENQPAEEQKISNSAMDAEVKAKTKDMWAAAQLGDAAKIVRLVESLPEGRFRDALLEVRGDDRTYADTPLLRATRCGRAEAVEALIKLGAKATAKNKLGNNALHLAAGYGHTGVMKLLLDNGSIDIEEKGQWGRTALHHAAAENRPEAVKILIKKGANIEARGGHFERTPLGMAAHFGRDEIVNMLCEAGANVNATDADGETVLHLAATTGKTETGRLLIRRWKASVEATDHDSWTPLLTASAEGHTDFVMMLLKEFNAHYKVQTHPEGHTIIHVAAEFGRKDTIAAILNHVKDFHDIIGEGTPLERLINFKNKRGDTPLHVACGHAALPAVEILVQCGADINERNAKNATPLSLVRDVGTNAASLSVAKAARDIVQLLRSKGAVEL